MEALQNSTQDGKQSGIETIPRPYSQLTAVQQAYVDYKAVNGLIIDEENNLRKMSVQELADKMHVHRTAFYDSVKYMPNFWDLVAERRKVLNSQTRLARIHEVWYLKAAGGSWPHMEAWLRNSDPDYKEPKQKLEHDIGEGLADALNIARERQRKLETVQEAEIVDAKPDA